MSHSVCAVVFPARGEEDLAPTLQALDQQTRRPEEMVVVRRPADFHQELRRALEGACAWFWLLDGSAVPEPGALESLLEALEHLDPFSSPVLLAGKVVTPDGSLDPRSLPIPQIFDSDLATGATERRMLSVRVARRGSLLVHRRGIEAHGLPGAGRVLMGDDLVWTGRLLKHEAGVLVPASVAVRRTQDDLGEKEWTREALGSWCRLVFSDALEPRDRSWFAGRLLEHGLAAVRSAVRP